MMYTICVLIIVIDFMINDKILSNNNLILIDIGASGGVNPKWNKKKKNFLTVLFEPNKNAYEHLLKNKKKNEVIIQKALSEKKQNLNYYICQSHQASSFYKPNLNFLKQFYNYERFNITKEVTIETDTLDNQLFINDVHDLDFIKLDVQGYEFNILKGSNNSLKKTIGIEIECEISEMYINQPLFSDVNNFVQSKKFELFDLKRYYWKRKNGSITNNKKGQLIFVDALYLKSPERIINDYSNNIKKLIKSYYIYLYYGYTDLAKIILSYIQKKDLLSLNEIKILNLNINNIDKSKFVLPNFIGKTSLKKIFQRIANLFVSTKIYNKEIEWERSHYLGNDQDLGN